MALNEIVVYKGITLKKVSKTCWNKLDENGKVVGYYKTLKIAKQCIDKKESEK